MPNFEGFVHGHNIQNIKKRNKDKEWQLALVGNNKKGILIFSIRGKKNLFIPP